MFTMVSTYLLGAALVSAAAPPDTLVLKGKDGAYVPGIASAWRKTENSVVFEIIEGIDANEVKAAVQASLATATVTLRGRSLEIAGVPPDTLLEQLSALSLTGEAGDPLAALASLQGGVSMDRPEGGGSIRATKLGALPRILEEHDAGERVTAEVLAVERGVFPNVALTLKVRRSAKTGPLKELLRKGSKVSGVVVLSGQGSIDYEHPATQRNIGAFYLEKGDRVVVHALPGVTQGTIELDYVARETSAY